MDKALAEQFPRAPGPVGRDGNSSRVIGRVVAGWNPKTEAALTALASLLHLGIVNNATVGIPPDIAEGAMKIIFPDEMPEQLIKSVDAATVFSEMFDDGRQRKAKLDQKRRAKLAQIKKNPARALAEAQKNLRSIAKLVKKSKKIKRRHKKK